MALIELSHATKAYWTDRSKRRARIVLDDPHGTARLNDLPVSFSPYNRQYAYRAAREMWNTFPANDAHDPMLELGGD